jgi:hypothetical protein
MFQVSTLDDNFLDGAYQYAVSASLSDSPIGSLLRHRPIATIHHLQRLYVFETDGEIFMNDK